MLGKVHLGAQKLKKPSSDHRVSILGEPFEPQKVRAKTRSDAPSLDAFSLIAAKLNAVESACQVPGICGLYPSSGDPSYSKAPKLLS